MSEDIDANLGSGLALETELPIRWHPGAPDARARRQQSNEDVLRLIYGLDDRRPELTDEDPPVAHELSRLDFKVNLLLDVVGQILLTHLELPPPAPVRVSSEEIAWRSARPPVAGEAVEVEVYLDLRYPRAVFLPGRVTAVVKDRVTVRYEELGDGARDWLEKFIFRSHRREVARIRRER